MRCIILRCRLQFAYHWDSLPTMAEHNQPSLFRTIPSAGKSPRKSLDLNVDGSHGIKTKPSKSNFATCIGSLTCSPLRRTSTMSRLLANETRSLAIFASVI